eukprot:scaffold100703_cov33-Phaeocystis_antarctica.AAC.1
MARSWRVLPRTAKGEKAANADGSNPNPDPDPDPDPNPKLRTVPASSVLVFAPQTRLGLRSDRCPVLCGAARSPPLSRHLH